MEGGPGGVIDDMDEASTDTRKSEARHCISMSAQEEASQPVESLEVLNVEQRRMKLRERRGSEKIIEEPDMEKNDCMCCTGR
jgi:hypothetical protein